MSSFQHESADLHQLYVEKLQLFACLVFSRTLCETVYKFQASCFDELSFFPRAEGRFLCSVKVIYSLRPTMTSSRSTIYLKFILFQVFLTDPRC